jgi:EAL domain-containing protein (putative c-di-GMP-specific phosphodiesterase class I)
VDAAGRGQPIRIRPCVRRDLLDALATRFSAIERRDSRALLLDDPDRPPDWNLAGNVLSFQDLVARQTAAWLAELLEQRRLTCHFQPIVHAASGEVFGHECLLRGLSPEGALIGPDRLFGAARDGDLLLQLDRLARETAVTRAAQVATEGTLFINFTPNSIYDPKSCLQTTMRAVQRSGIDRSRIHFEVTESDRIDDFDHLVHVLAFYREAGFKVALDDLGAGFASLGLLARLKPDIVKIDMGLVRRVDEDPTKAAIVRNLLDLARQLGIATIAEGVETAKERAWLVAAGADHLQGYLFARPSAIPAC